MGADLLKSILETDHVPKAERIDPIKSSLIRDDLHMRAHLRSKGHLFIPALKEIRTRAKHLLQWHAEKHPLRCILRVQEAITLLTSWFGGGCPIRGSHLFIFAREV
jgi:hypothetical protein